MTMADLHAVNFRSRYRGNVQVNHGLRNQYSCANGLACIRRRVIAQNRRGVNFQVAYLSFPTCVHGAEYHIAAAQFRRGVVGKGLQRLLLCGLHVLNQNCRPCVFQRACVFGAVSNRLSRHASTARRVGGLLKRLQTARQPGTATCTSNRGSRVVVR